jgi:hypothetical protein
MCRLRFLEVYIALGEENFYLLSILIRSLCISLTSPATLEHLKFNILLRGSIYRTVSNTFFENLRDADVWWHLDSIATHPTGSRLQRVDVNFDYIFNYDEDVDEPDEDKVEKAILDGLPLLRTKGILFVKAVSVK